MQYNYDASGNRGAKIVSSPQQGSKHTWYVRDAQGNVLATYSGSNNTVEKWSEQHLYGSSRLGMWKPDVNLAQSNGTAVWDTVGKKFFELNNHLGIPT